MSEGATRRGRLAALAATLSLGATLALAAPAAALEPLAEIGSSGSGAGQLNFPIGMATDAAGRLFVADGDNNRVSQFTGQGGFARAFGFDVVPGGATGFELCTAGTGCKAGTSGAGVGQFAGPQGVAADCRGAVYVAESIGGRVQRFGEAGTPPPPCPSGGGGNQPLSNEFSFGKVKKNKKRGTAKLTVIVPGPGGLELAKTKKVKGDDERAEARGNVKLAVKSRGKAKRKLNKRGKAKVTAEVAYTPDGGAPNTESTKVKLVKK
jgi:DNA-binding beta-propeller fold protein YncE